MKGGDPAVFGGTAEEVAAYNAAGVPVRICPGITAASAAGDGARAGGRAARPRLAGAGLNRCDARHLYRPLRRRDADAAAAGGRPRCRTPVLVVVNASLPDERIIRGRLSSLAFLVEAVSASDPAILIVGEAVGTVPIAATVRLREVAEQ